MKWAWINPGLVRRSDGVEVRRALGHGTWWQGYKGDEQLGRGSFTAKRVMKLIDKHYPEAK